MYSFADKKRDLADILTTVIRDEPRFISNFSRIVRCSEAGHSWRDDILTPAYVKYRSRSSNFLDLCPEEAAKLRAGDTLVPVGGSSVFVVVEVGKGNAHISLLSANGSGTTVYDLPTNGGIFRIMTRVDREQATNEEEEEVNAVQTVTRYIVTPTSDNSWCSIDNQVNRQTAVTLSELARDLNVISLFGFCYEDKKMAGGLYYYATCGGLEIDSHGAFLDSYLINKASQAVMAEGGEPMQILCSPGKAQIISREYKDRFQILRSDDRRGAYVAVIVNEINGRGMTIIADPDVPDTDAWLLDTSCFGLAIDSVYDYDSPLDGFDGIRRKVEAKVTFEFKNPKQRCCRIRNLKNSLVFKGV